jgi:cytosolic nonspecific dipeptidase
VTGKNVLLLPMGSGDDGAHSQNEKIELRNYIEGVSINFYHFINLNVI